MLEKLQEWSRRYLENLIVPALIFVSAFLSLVPLLHSGYFNDDAINSQIRAVLTLEHKGLFEFTYGIFMGWVKCDGRFYPLAWYAYSLFYLVPSLVGYKMLILFCVLLNLGAFGYWIYQVTGSKRFAYLLLLLLPMFFQFKIGNDPILSYHCLMQLLFLGLMLSLIFYQRYLLCGKRIFMFLSILAYVGILATYEISYAFFVLYALLALIYRKDWSRSWKPAMPFLLAALLFSLLSIYLRANAAMINPVYKIHFSFWTYWKTLATQVLGAVPLVYYFNNPGHIFSRSAFWLNLTASDLIITALGSFLWVTIFKHWKDEKKPPENIFLFGVGSGLAVLPAVMIALSVKHQDGILGLPYLQVYFQCFGMLLVLMGCYISLIKMLPTLKQRNIAHVALGIVLIYINLANLQNNRLVVERINAFTLQPRQLLAAALENHLAEPVPEGARIIAQNSNAWDDKYFYFSHGKKKYDIMRESEYLKTLTETATAAKPMVQNFTSRCVYIVRYQTLSADTGWVILGRLKTAWLAPGKKAFSKVEVDALRIFIKQKPDRLFDCLYIKQGAPESPGQLQEAFAIPLRKNLLAGNTQKYELYAIPAPGKNIVMNEMVLGHAVWDADAAN